MSFKSIILNNPAYLSINNNNLKIKLIDTQDNVLVPIDDIATILLDNPQISITKEVLSSCSKNNISIITTDETHMPCGIMLPSYTYFKSKDVLFSQLNASESLNNKIWQILIKNKIKNQSKILYFLDKKGAKQLENLISDVLVGDKSNVEAQASRTYFIGLFDKNFNRRDDNIVNTFLNYGYAIVRSTLAKSLASKGFNCTLGIHHSSILNNFNLVDDLIEPFRALVDYKVYNMIFNDEVNIDIPFQREHKEKLVNIMHETVLVEKGEVRLITACDMLADSLIKAYNNKEAKLILNIEIKK